MIIPKIEYISQEGERGLFREFKKIIKNCKNLLTIGNNYDILLVQSRYVHK